MSYYYIYYSNDVRYLLKTKEAIYQPGGMKVYIVKPDCILLDDSKDKNMSRKEALGAHHLYDASSREVLYAEIRGGEQIKQEYYLLEDGNDWIGINFFAKTDGQAKFLYKRHFQRLKSIKNLASYGQLNLSMQFMLDDDEDDELELLNEYSRINHDETWTGKEEDDGCDKYYEDKINELLENRQANNRKLSDEEIEKIAQEAANQLSEYFSNSFHKDITRTIDDLIFKNGEEINIVDGGYKGKSAKVTSVDFEHEELNVRIEGLQGVTKLDFNVVEKKNKKSNNNYFKDINYYEEYDDEEDDDIEELEEVEEDDINETPVNNFSSYERMEQPQNDTPTPNQQTMQSTPSNNTPSEAPSVGKQWLVCLIMAGVSFYGLFFALELKFDLEQKDLYTAGVIICLIINVIGIIFGAKCFNSRKPFGMLAKIGIAIHVLLLIIAIILLSTK